MSFSKYIILIILFVFSYCQKGYADWQLESNIYIGNAIANSNKHTSMVYNPYNDKIYTSSFTNAGKIFVFDRKTLVGIETINLPNIDEFQPVKYSIHTLFLDYEKNILYACSYEGFSVIDCNTHKEIKSHYFDTTFYFSGTINPYTFVVDTNNNIVYVVTKYQESVDKQYLIAFDVSSLTELYRIEVPRKPDLDFSLHLTNFNLDIYKAGFYDEETGYYYLAFDDIVPEPEDRSTFYTTHFDSVYVIDTHKQNILKTIPVGARPRDIIKNPDKNEIYVYCVGNFEDFHNVLNETSNKGVISVLNDISGEPAHNFLYNKTMSVLRISQSSEKDKIYASGSIISTTTFETIGTYSDKQGITSFYQDTYYDEIGEELYALGDSYLSIFSDSGALKTQFLTGYFINGCAINFSENVMYYSFQTLDQEYLGIYDLGEQSVSIEYIPPYPLNNFEVNQKDNFLYSYQVNPNNTLLLKKYNVHDNIFIIGEETPFIVDGTIELFFDEMLDRVYVLASTRNTYNSFLFVFDSETLNFINKIDLSIYEPHSLSINPYNHRIYILDKIHVDGLSNTQEKNTILCIDGNTYEEILRRDVAISNGIIPHQGGWRGDMALDSDENIIYAIHPNEAQISYFDGESLEKIGVIDYSNNEYGFLFGNHLKFDIRNRTLIAADGQSIIIADIKTKEIKYGLNNVLALYHDYPIINPNTGKLLFVSTNHNIIQVFEDTDNPGYIPPSFPTPLTATAAEAAITISWPPVDHSDVQGYKVYRSPAGADQWTKLNTELVTHTSFLDETAVPNTPYDYHVRTTGLYNISSDPSVPVTATLTINPGFSLSSILSSQSTEKGATIEYIITSESIEQFATLIDLSVEGLAEGINATLSSNQLRPGDVTSLTVDIAEDFAPDIYAFEVVGIADGIEHRVPLILTVVETEQEDSALTLSLSSKSIEFGDAMFATGRIIPAVITPVSILFTSSNETRTVSTTSLSDGTFSIDFEPESSGEWTVEASWAGNDDYSGADSELKVFDALSGQTKITCTTDVSADAEVGWQMTIKGTVFPNPGVGDVVLYVTKPDGTKETVDGLKINELGYYGYNITADQPGFWEVTAGWAGNSRYLGSVSETLIVPYGLDIGRAIIVVSPKQNKPFYYTANRLGNLAYQTFSKRRFDNPRIKYFDIDTTQDLNEDGFTGDVDGEPTLENVTEAISTWSAAAVNEETPLCIYLIGEGSLDGIELSDGNLLSASYLADLLSDVETTTGCDDVIVVVDAPHSGKFVSELSKLGRCVVTSTNLGKSNYIGNGKLSFSQYFLNYAYQGKSLRDSFLYTKRVLSNLPGAFKKQEPQVEGEGNLFANESSDFLKTANWYFGSSYGLQDLMPRVKSMSLASVTGQGGGVGKIVTNTHNVLSDERTPSLKLAKSVAAQGVDVWVRVDDAESNIASVFATVFSPSDSVLLEVELFDPDSDGKYEGIVYGLDDIGAYDIVAYAFDESENVSEPMNSLVMVVEHDVVLEPPTDVRVDDVPGDNGYQVNVSWGPSPSEDESDVGWYRIYRSRQGKLTSVIPLTQFTSIDSLKVYEESYTILVDSVAVGQDEYIDAVPMIGVNYYYWVDATGPTGASKKVAAGTPTFVNSMPTGFVVHQPYPNPFNPTTTIRYELPVETHVEFIVYDVLGRKVKVMENGVRSAGSHEVVWDGKDEEGFNTGSGVYMYQVKSGNFMKQGKMVLMR